MLIENSVSVIIPVYNAEKYIEKSVFSALNNKETLEVIIIEDGSLDNSLSICKKLSKLNKVVLIIHEGNKNMGPGISRNVGIRYAKGDFIAFLDADDFYLPKRFERTLKTFISNEKIDGVYETIGVLYGNELNKEIFIDRMKKKKKNILKKTIPIDHTGIEQNIDANSLFFHLIKNDLGWIHLNGLTVKSKSIKYFDLFRKDYLAQDTDFIIRLSFEKILSGTNSNNPVAIRRIHSNNRILEAKMAGGIKIDNEYWLRYSMNRNTPKRVLLYLLLRVTDTKYKIVKLFKILFKIIQNPIILRKIIFNI